MVKPLNHCTAEPQQDWCSRPTSGLAHLVSGFALKAALRAFAGHIPAWKPRLSHRPTSRMAPHKIKIVYYDAKGRAEVSRLVLAAGGINWGEVTINDETWKTEKEKTPFGQLPVIEVDGKRYAQSVAIANFVAKEAGLYGKNNLESLKIDQVVQLAIDCLNSAIQAFHEKDEAKKAEKLKTFSEVDAPKYFAWYEKLLKESGTGYFVGNSLTLADFFIYDQVFTPSKWKAFKTDGFPLLQALKQKVESHDKVKTYLANRKETEF